MSSSFSDEQWKLIEDKFQECKQTQFYKHRIEQRAFADVAKELILTIIRQGNVEPKAIEGWIHLFAARNEPTENYIKEYLSKFVKNLNERERIEELFDSTTFRGYTAVGKSALNELDKNGAKQIANFLMKIYEAKSTDEIKLIVKRYEALRIPEVTCGIYSPWVHYLNPTLCPIVNGALKNFLSLFKLKKDYVSLIDVFGEIKSHLNLEDFGLVDAFVANGEIFMGKEKWIPDESEYSPMLSKEKWCELVRDKTIFTENSLITFACIKAAKISSCKSMANEFGRSYNFYNTNNWQTGKRVFNATNCPLSERDEGENRFWSVCCQGANRYGEFVFKIRSELQAAFDETGVLDKINIMDFNQNPFISKCVSLLKMKKNIILQGAPGTGKTWNTAEIAVRLIDGENAKVSEHKDVMTRYEQLQKEGQIAFCTFHQSMDYEDFVEGLKPEVVEGGVNYKVEDGIFKKICKRAKKNTEKQDTKKKNYVLIIDEINRGNVSKIFGELITLLEADKRLDGDHPVSVTLPYSKDDFSVPANLYIIGTMNTTDRSTGNIDYAVRRRFAFVTLESKEDLITNATAKSLFNAIKDFIEKHKTEMDISDLMPGHSYFMAKDESELKLKFEYEIVPLLREYVKDGLLNMSENDFFTKLNVKLSENNLQNFKIEIKNENLETENDGSQNEEQGKQQ